MGLNPSEKNAFFIISEYWSAVLKGLMFAYNKNTFN